MAQPNKKEREGKDGVEIKKENKSFANSYLIGIIVSIKESYKYQKKTPIRCWIQPHALLEDGRHCALVYMWMTYVKYILSFFFLLLNSIPYL
jgi:hypothetical protein